MTLYLYSAWILALLFATIVGDWHGGALSAVIPVAVILFGILVAAAMRVLPARATVKGPLGDHDSLLEQASDLCHDVSAPSMVLNNQLVAFANETLLRTLGYSGRRDEVVGLPTTNLIHPRDHGRLAALVASAAVPSKSESVVELSFLKADGGILRRQVSVSPLSPDHDAVLAQLASGTNPSQPFRSAFDQAEAVLDQLDLALFHVDDSGCIVYANRAWARLCDHVTGPLVGRIVTTDIHPEDRDAVQIALNAVAEGRRDLATCEARLTSAKGSLLWIDLRVFPVVTRDGELIGVSGTMTEKTRRKHTDDSLLASRRHVNTLLANVPGMVYRGRNDRYWTMEFVSDGSLELTGYEPDELVDNARVSFGSLVHPDDREFLWTQVQSSLAQFRTYHVSYRLIDASGILKWVWEQGRGVFASNGELLAVEGFITDVRTHRSASLDVEDRSWFDAQTGLVSRPFFDNMLAFVLQHARLAGYPCLVLWIDIDDLWSISERFGRQYGDQVIVTVARRIRLLSGPSTVVTRSGGDQFAMLVTDFHISGLAQATPDLRDVLPAAVRLSERLSQELALPISIDGQDCVVTASIGVAISNDRYPGAEAILEASRKAAKDAHEIGPGHCEFANE